MLKPSLAKARSELERLEREYNLKWLRMRWSASAGRRATARRNSQGALSRRPHSDPRRTDGRADAAGTDQLFRILTALKERGTTVILISHKLREIMAVTDLVHVMRHGEVVASRKTAQTSREDLAELMVGRKVLLSLDKAPAKPGQAVMSADRLTVATKGGVALLDNVSFTLRASEIVGIAGVSGNGQTELLEVLSAIRQLSSGTLTIGDRQITPSHPAGPREMRKLGVAHVPEDRHRYGMAGEFTASETSILGVQRQPPFVRRGLLDYRAMARHCAALMERYDVRPRRPQQRATSFSGGNQQKLVLARETAQAPRILLVGQPTRGVDIGAIEFIHRQLVALRDAGCAILVVSVELDEVMSLAGPDPRHVRRPYRREVAAARPTSARSV